MPVFIAIKSLTATDLTYFATIYRRSNVAKQKAINLNANVLIEEFYPALSEHALTQPRGEISFPLSIYGPNAAGLYPLRRKIIKGGSYKNWRLNGELIHDPEEEPGRFGGLQPSDLAVLGFQGRVAPETVTMILLAQADAADAGLVANLSPLAPPGGRRSMASVTATRLEDALVATGAAADHPLRLLARDPVLDAALDDAALGDAGGAAILHTGRPGRPVTPEELARAKERAERTGADGETLVDIHFRDHENPGGTWAHEWTSARNAVAPYDFRCRSTGGVLGDQEFKVDVKTTRSAWTNDFHMSLGELREAARSTVPYRIYRMSDLDETGGTLRISGDVRDFARQLLEAHDGAMPGKIRADSFSIPVDAQGLTWDAPIRIEPPDEDDIL